MTWCLHFDMIAVVVLLSKHLGFPHGSRLERFPFRDFFFVSSKFLEIYLLAECLDIDLEQ